MEYKGFAADITYNQSSNRFDGTVIGASDDIEFTGKSISELESNFKAAVDKHLARCETKKLNPYRSYPGSFSLRFSDPSIHRDCAIEAQKARLSLNRWVEEACLQKLGKRG